MSNSSRENNMKYTNSESMKREFIKAYPKLVFTLFDAIADATLYLPAQVKPSEQAALKRLRRVEKDTRELMLSFVRNNGDLDYAGKL